MPAAHIETLVILGAGGDLTSRLLLPAIALKACQALSTMQLPDGVVLALEKPFGSDAKSARALNRLLEKMVPEDQVFRVDHFLGKSTVLNLIGMRFANRLFEPLFS